LLYGFVIMNKLATILSLAFLGCSSNVSTPSTTNTSPDAAASALDPTGNWSVTYAFQASCGTPSSTTDGTFTVTVGSAGYQVDLAGVESDGAIECTVADCELSGTFEWVTDNVGFEQSMNLSMNAQWAITGAGTEQVIDTNGDTCVYPFTVTGSRM
jgi:hypothetical protein